MTGLLTRPDARILRGYTGALSFQFVDADGTAAAPVGTVTVGIAKADGTVVVAAGAATSGAGSAPRTYTLAAAPSNATLEMLTVTWTDSGGGAHVQHVEVVSGYYFSVADARAADPSLKDTVKYPTADVVAVRQEVEEEAERICNRAFLPRYRRVTVDGSGTDCLVLPDPLPRTVRSVTVNSSGSSVTYTAGELANLRLDRRGTIHRQWGAWFEAGDENITVEYECGDDRPPGEIVRAAITRLRSRLNASKSDIPDRAERYVGTEGGVFSLSMPGPWETGMPEVDAEYDRYSLRGAAFA